MQTKGMPEGNEATNPQTRKGHHSQSKREKAKGISQMIAGAAVAVIGVPLCVLPGPGVAVIACGVALASRGQRTYSGRKPTKVERRLDAAAEKLGSAAKKEAGKIAKTASRTGCRSFGRRQSAKERIGHGCAKFCCHNAHDRSKERAVILAPSHGKTLEINDALRQSQ